ncbi:uncharacterized protein A1O9_07042 [Exophiala aquamarina CBS 119918]|uniref:Transcription factor domain-containing protein n=1 Tax=Exophiala aquamarina CBS 119918 TaxID=1182545 RepID=A0A072PAS5_9EURO|nr:uncharacterized protein A1O9_07042 [Exophiala aquamarina CBS 119918]KEF56852.1 hypothetical protein A1O9_07042 [Exophiala aquamarina CBS 119918]
MAVECLCAAHSIFLSSGQDRKPVPYGKALKSLRHSLANIEEALSSEVLCAIICLSWCEALINSSSSGWVKHFFGSSRIIQLRGPQKHQEGFGRALLHAEHGLLSSASSIADSSCFLDHIAWQNAVDSPLPERQDPMKLKIVIEHFNLMTKLSVLREDLAQVSLLNSPTTVSLLFDKLQKLYHLRVGFKQNLRLTSVLPDILDGGSPPASKDYAIIFCKNALGHITVNLALLELQRTYQAALLNVHFPTTTPPFPPLPWENSVMGRQFPPAKHLDLEIDGLVELVSSSFEKALLATPITSRRIVFSYRVICSQVFKQKDYHPVWDRIYAIICRAQSNKSE